MARVFKNAGDFFGRRSPVHLAAEALARRLGELQAPFVVTGGFALGGYGYERMTDDIDIVVREQDWRRFKERWVGLGYREKFQGSKAVIDTENDVKIPVLFVGGFPGDGKPKPVAFPDPTDAEVVVASGAFPVVSLEMLIQLKIASGKTAPGRQLRDYGDVVELIRCNTLSASFAERLDPYVREEFLHLHRIAGEPADLDE
ncbi:MAG: hypothetical protein KF878_08275 [Planctomycetes bacterium]|nr:hypothetical protein [Planctomycetota bacterium]